MRILLDECVPKKLKKSLTDYEVKTVPEMDFNGLKDKELLEAAEKAKFDILLTIDKRIDYQQNIKKYHLTIVIFDALKNTINFLESLVPKFKKEMNKLEKGKSYRISDKE